MYHRQQLPSGIIPIPVFSHIPGYNITELEKRIDRLERQFERINRRQERINTRLQRVERQLGFGPIEID
ncbi:hypothetical protein [Peribacillus alkalitolerans]|uniref:hypothetical protein n=1 Tax=Peribacillus alkalitolerans TaxID=1550385 RepID=UPI0013D730CC|nr:hypothetical protein [Peribacillus alkalitolerans]